MGEGREEMNKKEVDYGIEGRIRMTREGLMNSRNMWERWNDRFGTAMDIAG